MGVILRTKKNGNVVYHHSDMSGNGWKFFDCKFPVWKDAREFDLAKEG